MSATDQEPRTLLEAVRYFADPDRCLDFAVKFRWANGKPVCPHCGGIEHSFISTRRIWKCKSCKRQFSVKVGSIFEDSPIGFDKWFPAMWMIANSKNGVSSHELARALGVTQKTAWFMCHRLRLAMQTGSFQKLSGTVEVDETFVGGLSKNMHKDARKQNITGTGGHDKTIVVGIKQRGGNVKAKVVANRLRPTLQQFVRDEVELGSAVYTDSHHAYRGLADDFDHATVEHAERYVNGRIHTNGIENFWSLLKRGLKGTYVCAQPDHLFRYLDERVFTYNMRDLDDLGRMKAALGSVGDRRVTYSELIGKH